MYGFRKVLGDLGLARATIAVEKNFFDAALYEVFKAHILPAATVVSATPMEGTRASPFRLTRTLQSVRLPPSLTSNDAFLGPKTACPRFNFHRDMGDAAQ